MPAVPPFSPEELTVKGVFPGFGANKDINILSAPVSDKEAMIALYERRPIFQTVGIETELFLPSVIPENVARAMCIENKPFNPWNKVEGKICSGSSGSSSLLPGVPWRIPVCPPSWKTPTTGARSSSSRC